MCCGFVSLSNSWNFLDIWNILNCCETFPRYRISINIVWISWINAIYFKKHYCCLFENNWMLSNLKYFSIYESSPTSKVFLTNTSNIMNVWDKIWKMVNVSKVFLWIIVVFWKEIYFRKSRNLSKVFLWIINHEMNK